MWYRLMPLSHEYQKLSEDTQTLSCDVKVFQHNNILQSKQYSKAIDSSNGRTMLYCSAVDVTAKKTDAEVNLSAPVNEDHREYYPAVRTTPIVSYADRSQPPPYQSSLLGQTDGDFS